MYVTRKLIHVPTQLTVAAIEAEKAKACQDANSTADVVTGGIRRDNRRGLVSTPEGEVKGHSAEVIALSVGTLYDRRQRLPVQRVKYLSTPWEEVIVPPHIR